MTDYRPAPDPKEGDRVTIQFTLGPQTTIRSEHQSDQTIGSVFAPLTDAGPRRLVVGDVREYTIRFERPTPELPTRPGAVVMPNDPSEGYAYFLDEIASEWRGSLGGGVPACDVKEALADDTHHVAFEGVEE